MPPVIGLPCRPGSAGDSARAAGRRHGLDDRRRKSRLPRRLHRHQSRKRLIRHRDSTLTWTSPTAATSRSASPRRLTIAERENPADAPAAFGSTLAEWSGTGDTEQRWRARLRDVALQPCPGAEGRTCRNGQRYHSRRRRAGRTDSLWGAPAAKGKGSGTRPPNTSCDGPTRAPNSPRRAVGQGRQRPRNPLVRAARPC